MERNIGPSILSNCSLSLPESRRCRALGCPLLQEVNGAFFPYCRVSLHVFNLAKGLQTGNSVVMAPDTSRGADLCLNPEDLTSFASRMAIKSYCGRIPPDCSREWNKIV